MRVIREVGYRISWESPERLRMPPTRSAVRGWWAPLHSAPLSRHSIATRTCDMVPNRKGGLPAVLIAPLLVLMLGPGLAQAQGASPGAKGAITGIELTFRRDLRDVDAFRGVGVWSTAPVYNGVAAQDTVEIPAKGARAQGRPGRITPQW